MPIRKKVAFTLYSSKISSIWFVVVVLGPSSKVRAIYLASVGAGFSASGVVSGAGVACVSGSFVVVVSGAEVSSFEVVVASV